MTAPPIEQYNDLVAQIRANSTRLDDVAVTLNLNSMLRLADWCISTSRLNSIWPFSFGLACCAIEMMATAGPRYDMDRFGAGVFRGSPRQADLMIVAGTVTYKMGECIRRLWHQMPEPKWVIAMGACATNGGPYDPYGYHVMKGVDLVVPVDVYTPGCPPRPESLIESLICLQDMIRSGKDREARAAWEKTHAARRAADAMARDKAAAGAFAAPETKS
jgi:NADH-quinone oxidoreductase subunit B